MPSPTSTVSPLTFSASPSAAAPPPAAARSAAERPAFGGDADAFARTLQRQLDRRPQHDERPSGIEPRMPAPPREAQQARPRAAAAGQAAGEHEAAAGPGRERAPAPASASAGEGSQRSGACARVAPDSEASVPVDAADAAAGAAERAATLAAAADAAAANSPDAAALAAAPAVLAALGPPLADPGARADDAALDGGARRFAPDPSLAAKTAAGAQTGEADAALADQAPAQARPAPAAALTAALAERPGGTRADAAADGSGAHTQSASTGAAAADHGAPLFSLLRPVAGAPPSAPQWPVHTAASARAWAEDVGNQVRWMLGRAESRAELVLTPPSLGRLEVSISLSGEQTTAHFVASSQAARDALEQAMPRLREILQQAGIQLGQANVSTAGEQSAHDEGGRQDRRGGGAKGEAPGAGSEHHPGPWLRPHGGMVDTFA